MTLCQIQCHQEFSMHFRNPQVGIESSLLVQTNRSAWVAAQEAVPLPAVSHILCCSHTREPKVCFLLTEADHPLVLISWLLQVAANSVSFYCTGPYAECWRHTFKCSKGGSGTQRAGGRRGNSINADYFCFKIITLSCKAEIVCNDWYLQGNVTRSWNPS